MLRELFRFKDEPHVAERVVHPHEYDIAVASRLVRGCDIWLSRPGPPLAARTCRARGSTVCQVDAYALAGVRRRP